jgi:hypothetical protein
MTEAEGMTCADPSKLLDHLKSIGHLRIRELRLFALSCARRFEYLLTEGDVSGRRALAAAEEMAAGRADPATIAALQEQVRSQAAVADAAQRNALDAVYNTLQDSGGVDYTRPSREGYPRLGGDWLYEPPDLMETVRSATRAAHQPSGDEGDCFTSEAVQTESGQQATMLRDIFGNPFRPVSFDPSRLTSMVTALA